MIKLIMIIIFLVIFALISIPLYFLVYLIGLKNPRKKAEVSQKIVVGALRFILFMSGIKVVKSGTENISKDDAVLYVSNHRGYFDILAIYCTVPTLAGFVSKKALKSFPCVSSWMKRLNCLFLDRTDIRQGMKTILQGVENIKSGYSMVIMPEGTRSKDGSVLPFHDASFKMSEKSGCSIVPVAIIGTDERFEKNNYLIRGGTVYIRYGKPVNLTSIPKEERKHPGKLFRQQIVDMLEDMKSEIEK